MNTQRLPRYTLVSLIIFLLLVVFIIVIANSSAPGDPLYGIDRSTEKIELMLKSDGVAKAEKYVDLAEERLDEMGKITGSDSETTAFVLRVKAEDEQGLSEDEVEDVEGLVEDYEENMDAAADEIDKAKAKGQDVDEVLERVSEATLKHAETLSSVYDKVPDQAKDGILSAMEKSLNGHERSLSAVSGQKREEIQKKVEEKKQEVEQKIEEKKQEAQERRNQAGQENESEDVEEDFGDE